jgi:hypothetical protein
MPSRPIRSAMLWTAFHAVLWIVPTLALAWILPRCMTIFMDHGIDPGGTTRVAVVVGRMIVVGLPVVVAMIATILAVDFVAIRRLRSASGEQGSARRWIAAMTALSLAYFLFTITAIGVPLLEIRSRLNG